MAHEEHTHEWKYNEAVEHPDSVLWDWSVVRFCTQCFEVEEIELKTINPQVAQNL